VESTITHGEGDITGTFQGGPMHGQAYRFSAPWPRTVTYDKRTRPIDHDDGTTSIAFVDMDDVRYELVYPPPSREPVYLYWREVRALYADAARRFPLPPLSP
jgi:hypothetical protein